MQPPPDLLYHGTGHCAVEAIMQMGLCKMSRHHDHLSTDKAIAPSSAQKMNIRVQLCPTGKQIYLPPGLQLTVFDASGNTSPELEAQARSVLDNWIQLEFSGELGEQFSVKVSLGDFSITEDFTV